MIEVKTDHPLAVDIVDHIYPDGILFDNNSNFDYIGEVEQSFSGRKLKVLDLGCAGGQLAVDFFNRGHKSVGIEGSDYAITYRLHNWPGYHNKCLFTADLRFPFEIIEDGEPMKFDFINSWEVFEHIPHKSLETFFYNIQRHLHPDGLFVGSVATGHSNRYVIRGSGQPDQEVGNEQNFYVDMQAMLIYGPKLGSDWGIPRPITTEQLVEGNLVAYHQSVFQPEWWAQTMRHYFRVGAYPYRTLMRPGCSPYHFMLKQL